MQDLRLRKVKINDKNDLFAWRNDPVARSMSFNTEPLGIKEHEDWFKKMLKSKKKVLYIGETSGHKKAGVISFNNIGQNRYEINVNVAPDCRGIGLGTLMIKEGSYKLISENKAKEILARVKLENMPSIKAFSKAGFIKINKKEGILEMKFKGVVE